MILHSFLVLQVFEVDSLLSKRTLAKLPKRFTFDLMGKRVLCCDF